MMTQLLQPGSSNLLLTSLGGWLVVANLLAFLGFFLDHRRALADERPMPEMPLLVLSSVGGWLGAQLGRMCFQVQSRERSFGIFLNISILPMLALAGMMAAQDMDWSIVAGKITSMMTPQTDAPPADAKAVATDPEKPVVTKPVVTRIAKKPATKDVSVTNNPDLPKRIGPGSKKGAWQSR